jgi:MFS family permease
MSADDRSTTAPPPPAPLASTVAADGDPPPRRLGRLGPVLLLSHLGWMLPVSASSTLIQALMEQIDAEAKIALYATLATAGAIAAALANIAFGALSDRTRTRFGARNPWILCGGLVAAGSLATMSVAPSFVTLVVLWMVFQVSLNAFLGPLLALLPDRVSPVNMGKASSLIGFGQLIAQSLGGIVAAQFLAVPREGLRWIPLALLIATLLVVLVLPGRDNRAAGREPFSLRTLLATFRPPRDADFAWALAGRFLLLLSFMLVVTYQLFLLTDHLELSTAQASAAIATGGVLMAVASGLATAVSGPISDKIGRRKPLVMLSAVLLGVATLPLAVAPTLASFYAFLLVGGFAYGIYVAVDQALMAEVLPDQDNRAKDLGILNVANTGPQILAPIVAGALVTGVGYRGVLLIALVIALASAACIKPIRRVR